MLMKDNPSKHLKRMNKFLLVMSITFFLSSITLLYWSNCYPTESDGIEKIKQLLDTHEKVHYPPLVPLITQKIKRLLDTHEKTHHAKQLLGTHEKVHHPPDVTPKEPEKLLEMPKDEFSSFVAGKISIVQTEEQSAQNAEFILFVPKNVKTPSIKIQNAFLKTLKENPDIDVVGGFMKTDNHIVHTCFDIEICHWTIIYHYEYVWSKGSLMQCDTTSHVFMARRKWLKHIHFEFGSLTPIDFFIKVKEMNGKVVSDVSQLIPMTTTVKSGQYTTFVKKYGVDQIRNRYTNEIVDLCVNCDGKFLRNVMTNKNWDYYGITMPNFAYKAYVKGFQAAVKFLNQNNMRYRVYGGAGLGLLKLGRLLPWDSGDVDILVDVSELGCVQWLQKLKKWADEQEFIHPHVVPAGRTCQNYGVYAMPRGSDVRDPFSLGLISFIGQQGTSKIGKTAMIRAHDEDAQVSLDLWKSNENDYGESALTHKKHTNSNHELQNICKSKWKHNCIKNVLGTHLDTCIEYTQFYHS